MPAALPSSQTAWRPGAASRFALLLWLTYAYFIPSPSWNPNSRFNLTLAVVEHGQLHIDPYHHNTGDKSHRNGHFYSDKAPGVAFLAVIPYAAFRAVWRWTGHNDLPKVFAVGRHGRLDAAAIVGDGDDDVLLNPAYRWGQYWATVFTSGLAAAVLGGLMLALCARWGEPPQRATAIAMALSLGTLVLPYATTLYGHVVAAAFCFSAFAVLAWKSDTHWHWQRLAAAGALAGLACTYEWPAAILLALLGVYVVYALGARQPWRAWPFIAGAVLPLALALLYNQAVFGGPFELGYAHLQRDDFAKGMGQGVMGVSWPSIRSLALILVGRERGLFYTTPILLLATWGLLRPAWQRSSLPTRALALAAVVGLVLLSSGYYMWWGGMALGPRHVVVALPFWLLGLRWALPAANPTANEPRAVGWHRHLVFACLSLSIVNMGLGTAVGPEAPLTGDLLFRYVYPLVATGRVPAAPGASNWGRLMGLPGILSLLPLAAVWIAYISRVWPLLPPPDASSTKNQQGVSA